MLWFFCWQTKPLILFLGVFISPLVHHASISPAGSQQQQVAAAGAIQAMAILATGEAALPQELQEEPVVHHLATILQSGPQSMRCAAAGALSNLVACPHEARVGRLCQFPCARFGRKIGLAYRYRKSIHYWNVRASLWHLHNFPPR